MITAGLTGGLASGKSFVAAAFAELGCHVVRADDLGHQALSPTGGAYPLVIEEFGREVLKPDGTIDRRMLAGIVFADPARLAALNAIVHPVVFRLEDEVLEQIGNRDPASVVIVEAAILIEAGSFRRFDRLILVVCTEEQQIQRAMERGLTREETMLRLSRQMPVAEKKKYANYVIDTSGSKERTIEQTREIYRILRSLNR